MPYRFCKFAATRYKTKLLALSHDTVHLNFVNHLDLIDKPCVAPKGLVSVSSSLTQRLRAGLTSFRAYGAGISRLHSPFLSLIRNSIALSY